MSYLEEQKRNRFKMTTKNPIIVDFNGISYLGEIHKELKEAFGLPEYYGENPDALWDCLDGLFDKETIIELRGLESLSEELKIAISPILEVFEDLKNDNPEIIVIIK